MNVKADLQIARARSDQGSLLFCQYEIT